MQERHEEESEEKKKIYSSYVSNLQIPKLFKSYYPQAFSYVMTNPLVLKSPLLHNPHTYFTLHHNKSNTWLQGTGEMRKRSTLCRHLLLHTNTNARVSNRWTIPLLNPLLPTSMTKITSMTRGSQTQGSPYRVKSKQ